MVSHVDDFTGTNNTQLEAYDSGWGANSSATFRIQANQCQHNQWANKVQGYNGLSFSADQYAQVTFTTAAHASAWQGPAVRVQDSSNAGYYLKTHATTALPELVRVDISSVTTLSSGTVACPTSSVLKIEIFGTSITAYKDGSTTGMPETATDSTYSTGSPGVFGYGTNSVDDFTGADATAPPTTGNWLDPTSFTDVAGTWDGENHVVSRNSVGGYPYYGTVGNNAYLILYSYDAESDVPAGATIDSVTVRVRAIDTSSPANVYDMTVEVSNDAGSTWGTLTTLIDNSKAAVSWTDYTTVDSLFGLLWDRSAGDLSNTNLRVRLNVVYATKNDGAYPIVDVVEVRFKYFESSTTLVVAESSHSHTADGNLALIQAHNLAIAESTHAHAVEGDLNLVQANTIAVNDAAHAHNVEGPVTLSTSIDLIVAESTHDHAADGDLNLVQAHTLAVNESTHTHLSDGDLSLIQAHTLAVDELLHAHNAQGDLSLLQANILAVDESTHGHAADGDIVLTIAGTLSVQGAEHSHAVDNVVLTAGFLLSVSDSIHDHSVEGDLDLIQGNILSVFGAIHSHNTEGNINLIQANSLAINESIHDHQSQGDLTLSVSYSISPDSAIHSHASDGNLVLSFVPLLQVNESVHSHLSDGDIELIQANLLSVNESIHAHYVDGNIVLNVHLMPTEGLERLFRLARVQVELSKFNSNSVVELLKRGYR